LLQEALISKHSPATRQPVTGFVLSVTPDLIDAIARRVAELLDPSPRSQDGEPWIGVVAAAGHLACKPQRIYDLVSQRRLPFRRDGRRVLFRRSDLDGYLAEESNSR
jgi:excisionase family DNA binding protein